MQQKVTSRMPKMKVQMMPLADSTVDATPITEPRAAMRSIRTRASGCCNLNTVVMAITTTISPISMALNHLLNCLSVIICHFERSREISFIQIIMNLYCKVCANKGRKLFKGSLRDAGDAAVVEKEPLLRLFSHALNLPQGTLYGRF